MNILFVSGLFDKNTEKYVEKMNKSYLEYTANNFQKNLIKGLIENGNNVNVVSAPFCGAWPNSSRIIYFRKTRLDLHDPINYVKFINIWGIRHISRYFSLKRYINKSVNIDAIVVYSAHNPFIKASIAYSKKKNIILCNIVPDLPEYMNLKSKKSFIYQLFKKKDINEYYKLSKNVDSFVVLTTAMAKRIIGPSLQKPYIILEGITDTLIKDKLPDDYSHPIKLCYAGKLEESFGVKKLIDTIYNNRSLDWTINICGSGELSDYIKRIALEDKRIIFHGFLSYKESREIMKESDILINPRNDDSMFSLYSFPSKNIEYLSLSKPVVCNLLSGMEKVYENFIFKINNDTQEGLLDAIETAINSDKTLIQTKIKNATLYINDNLFYLNASKRLTDLLNKGV